MTHPRALPALALALCCALAHAAPAAVRPQDDLFRAVNGDWLAHTPIPPDKASWGSFILLRDRADARVRALAEHAGQAPGASDDDRRIGDFYRAYVDEAAIDRAGLAPAQPWLEQIDAIDSREALARAFGRLQGVCGTPLWLAVGPDDREPTVHRLQTFQGGLGLPDRDYYLQDDARFVRAREAYRGYVETLLRLAGDAQAARSAQAVYDLERQLAQAQWSRVDNRDPVKLYNPMPPGALPQAAPGLDWPAMLEAGALPALDKVIVSQPDYTATFARLAAELPLETWRAYLRTRLLDEGAPVLPRPFREAHFAFRGKVLRGLAADEPRWQKATRALNGALGEAVGRRYVAQHFPPAYKARMQALVDHLLQAFGESIDGLAWMGPDTKQRAKDKLARYGAKIGYPEQWRDYSALEVHAGDAFGNLARAGRFEHERRARRAGQPVDRREWAMPPQTVNAYYSANFNEIVFPAAILEPPFFDMKADDATNYGAIGAIIGHEISHGFDDQGSRFDGEGKLDDWWTEADRKAFDAVTARLVAQYAAYEPVPGRHLNGRLTLGENIADLSGLQIAYKAWQLSLKDANGKRRKPPVVQGRTGEQRFFIGWASAWREKVREERALQLLTIDPHSPSEFRANGAAVNHDGFHQAFHTKPGDGMWKPADQRIRIW